MGDPKCSPSAPEREAPPDGMSEERPEGEEPERDSETRLSMQRVILSSIRFYRKNISPHTPPSCRFIPTCSEYAMEAVARYGAAKGSLLAARRLLKCQPFHRQNGIEYDPVPEKEHKL